MLGPTGFVTTKTLTTGVVLAKSALTISGSFGAPAAALDGHGDIWLAGDFGSGSMMKIESDQEMNMDF